ncbi:hypothetical protein ACQEU8_02390 [Streptomyces sp. CA-250714]|uniref:hypothetical protein n=1 Tax=Streptomyces sp. CA-250714 TaxID=3240060 RepID=UPI003D8C2B63
MNDERRERYAEAVRHYPGATPLTDGTANRIAAAVMPVADEEQRDMYRLLSESRAREARMCAERDDWQNRYQSSARTYQEMSAAFAESRRELEASRRRTSDTDHEATEYAIELGEALATIERVRAVLWRFQEDDSLLDSLVFAQAVSAALNGGTHGA